MVAGDPTTPRLPSMPSPSMRLETEFPVQTDCTGCQPLRLMLSSARSSSASFFTIPPSNKSAASVTLSLILLFLTVFLNGKVWTPTVRPASQIRGHNDCGDIKGVVGNQLAQTLASNRKKGNNPDQLISVYYDGTWPYRMILDLEVMDRHQTQKRW